MDKQGYLVTCYECNAVQIDGKINHYHHCSKWDGVKGRSVPVSSAHFDSLQALADERLVLLKEIAEVIELWDMGCPICGGWNHRKDCELAEAIAEE